ncbi:uncharacterized protein THITE_2141870 [Thermothielavioides terrestris NRRL 8126]|uniref:Peptidase M3A/M3B catalytic domain-containing protein n=1 Tax=Thermothielavioides terrestris (strain ATCC 38088 / NRRL 8126) TaxID=578455 RepID=G2QVS8_THETT|nr:uncharacterized protein THITE_2141870 [Thermothielavioides terrestris NRRL 8126]AEO63859.1 hypothetical protein THITE_2141870 [Thermothielavioides terrestris NRRL 8126]
MPPHQPPQPTPPPPPPPPFAAIASLDPDAMLATARAILEQSARLHDRLAATLTPETATFANLIRPLIDDANAAAAPLCMLGRLQAAASPHATVRAAAREVQKLADAAEDALFARADLAVLVAAVRRRVGLSSSSAAAAAALSSSGRGEDIGRGQECGPEERYLVEWLYGRFVRAGAVAAGDASVAARVCALRAEVRELCLAAVGALAEAEDGMWFTREELEGVPESGLSGLKMEKGGDTGGQSDRFWVPFRGAYDVNVLRDAVRPETRRKYDIASDRRFPENVGGLEKIIALRDEIARLLGYANHAGLAMEEKMSRSVDEVTSQLREIQQRLQPIHDLEIQRLQFLKLRHVSQQKGGRLDADDKKLYAWDWVFYASKQRAESYAIDAMKVAEYFEAAHTFARMLRVFERLFGLAFGEIETVTWHEDVRVYVVRDSESEGGAFLGYLYVELYNRPGKHQGDMHIPVQRGFVEASGLRHHPVSVLLCKFNRPAPAKPALLRYGQVITLFHELGHCIHNLVSRTKYGLPPPRDFVEIPSLVLEHWASVPEVLISLSKHYKGIKTGQTPDANRRIWDGTESESESLPRDLAESVARARSVNEAHIMLVMIHRALFDLTIHSPANHQAALEMDTTSLWNASQRDVVGVCVSEEPDEMSLAHGEFGHIFRKYDAGFFAYPMSAVWAADLFTHAFGDQPMDPEAGRSVSLTTRR